jgi:rhodanese-related sulfurtransferase
MSFKQLFEIAKDIFLICCVAAIVSLTINFFHSKGYLFVKKDSVKRKQIVQINSHEAFIKHKAKIGIFLDLRDEKLFFAKHIKGAVNFNFRREKEIVSWIKNNFKLLNQSREIILYDKIENIGSVINLALILKEMGYKRNIYILKNGISGWSEEGYPLKIN